MEIELKIGDIMVEMIDLIKEDNVNLIMISIKVSIDEEAMMEMDIIEVMIGEMMIMDPIKEVATIETLVGIIREINLIPLEEITNPREKIIKEIMEIEEIKIEEEEMTNRIMAYSKILDLVDHKDKMIKKVENNLHMMRVYI